MEETRKSIERLQVLNKALSLDIEKALGGRKLACQRARVTSVLMEKEFKIFRNISVKQLGLGRKA